MNTKLLRFFSTVKVVFENLFRLGFVIPEDAVEETPLYGRISFYGKHVCITFSYDLVEDNSECYVGKIDNGRLVVNRNEGGYWSSLYSYLVNRKAYRGKLPIKDDWLKHEFPELLAFRLLLTEEASEILEDGEDVFN